MYGSKRNPERFGIGIQWAKKMKKEADSMLDFGKFEGKHVNTLISVIVPVFNIKEYISKCIESIMKQTYRNLQILLVDDGSTDTSGEICDKYAEKDTRIQVIHKKNGGLVSARNAGLEAAVGEYIGFVDGDDYIDSEFYEILLEDMLKNDVDFVHMGYRIEDGDISRVCGSFETGKYQLTEKSRLNLAEEGIFGKGGTFQITPSIWSKLFKREFIQKCYASVPKEQSYGEDMLCLSMCMLEGQSMYLHKTAMYHYVNRQGSLMNSAYVSNAINIAELYYALKNLFMEYDLYEHLRPCLETYLARNMLLAIKKIGKNMEYVSFYYLKNIDVIKGKMVVIYGAGSVGQGYYAQISRYSSCTIVGWVDWEYQRYRFDYRQVQPVTELEKMQYDVILLAIKDANKAEQIKMELMEQRRIREEMIVWERPGSIIEEMN